MRNTTIVKKKRVASSALQSLIDQIEVRKMIDNPSLIEIIKQANLKESDFLQYNQFDHGITESYGRNKVYEGANFSIYIMSWSTGDFTAIHSHGYCAWGAVYFFGDTSHRLYKASGNKIELVNKGIVPKGTIAPVTGNLVHAMGNEGQSPVMTLHIYGSDNGTSNANDDSLVYELEKKRISTTSGEAYLNLEPERIKRSVTGISTNIETITDYFGILLPYYRKTQNRQTADHLEQILRNPQLYFGANHPTENPTLKTII
jgi:hypothetical protein